MIINRKKLHQTKSQITITTTVMTKHRPTVPPITPMPKKKKLITKKHLTNKMEAKIDKEVKF